VELGVKATSVKEYYHPLDEVPELGEDVLREQGSLVSKGLDVVADHFIGTLDLLANRSH